MNGSTPESWQSKVARKQQAVKANIPKEWLIPSRVDVSSIVLEIPQSHDAKTLLHLLSTGTLTSSEVTTAFCKRAAIAQQLTSCLTEIMFNYAEERAAFLDRYLAINKKVLGPLHGLPISLKDSFNVKGFQTSIEIVSFLDREPAQSNSVLVDTLLDLGAVLYVKTNVPHAVLTADSPNNIFGRTLNPRNTSLTAGGSSGGEGALIALRGSVLGVGTDLAGSIRTPSLYCGVYDFKPSSGRIPWAGQAIPGAKGVVGISGILPSAGPMANSLTDIQLFMSTVLGSRPWLDDSAAHAIPWRSEDLKETPLTIGILAEDPMFPLHPPIRRAIKKAIQIISAAGHKVIELEHEESTRASIGGRLAIEAMILDPSMTCIKNIMVSGEPMVPSLLRGTRRRAEKDPKTYGVLEIAAMDLEIRAYKEAWRELFKHQKLDVVLGPASQHTAI
ncbi:hypothetical protein HYALB_00006426 [Hymenoscyphus albidus]|uniref:amidase n=1 Tax=Hymenoscyphus albidus TaxID=595503 RepID=A0A9N9LNH5_9HELO|nr:hypothetical protein HYALB_00006426 [Hymenoscyphus albidus]